MLGEFANVSQFVLDEQQAGQLALTAPSLVLKLLNDALKGDLCG